MNNGERRAGNNALWLVLLRFFPCMTNVRIWLYRSSDSKKIKNSAVESMRFVVTLDVHINPATSIIYPGRDQYRHETEVAPLFQVWPCKKIALDALSLTIRTNVATPQFCKQDMSDCGHCW